MIAALLLLAQAAPAALPADPDRADARCLVALGSLAASGEEQTQRAGQLGALYFYGKLLGRHPAIDLKAAMVAAAAAVARDPRPELQRCGAELKQSGLTLQTVGAALNEMPPPPATK